MAVKIRLARFGRIHEPIYRIVATDSRSPRDSQFIENLGTYNPLRHELVKFHEDRLTYWVSQGAIVSDSVKKIFKMQKKAAATK